MDAVTYGAAVGAAKKAIEEALEGHGVVAGKSIDRIELTSTIGNTKTYSVYLEDDTLVGTFVVTDGEKGDTGEAGPQGPQGPSGTSVEIDDDTEANNKTWSSEKIKDYISESIGGALNGSY